MFTPQQIEEISFNRATFGGYDMQSVDEFLEPLTNDYITLYKENALLKSKMRVLVGKLEEYRQNEASMKEAMVSAQHTCDQMVRDAEAKCTQMLQQAGKAAADTTKNANLLLEEEELRLAQARKVTYDKIESLQAQLRGCLDTLEKIKTTNRPSIPVKEKPEMFDVMATEGQTDGIADEIAQNLEAMVGSTAEHAPKPEPKPAKADAATVKFSNLQFGRNYDPESK